jgi:hypothetical protein
MQLNKSHDDESTNSQFSRSTSRDLLTADVWELTFPAMVRFRAAAVRLLRMDVALASPDRIIVAELFPLTFCAVEEVLGILVIVVCLSV